MKICDIVQSFTARSGGIRTYIRAKQDYLRERSGVTHVLIKPGAFDRLRQRGNLREYEVAAPFVPGYKPYRFNIRLHKVAEILRQEQPDLIELASPYLDPWPVFAHRRRHGSAVVGYYHADFPSAYVEAPVSTVLGPAVGRAIGRCAERYARSVYGRCDLTITASRQCERRLAQFGVPRVARIPLGVDTRVFRPSRRDPRLWPRLLGPGRGPVLIYCGRLDREKQVEVLVDAHGQLPVELGARLVLVGDGPLGPQLAASARVNHRLTVVSYQRQRDKLAALLASADVYVTAGPFETFGLSILEAQACGLPVVGVAAGALIERVPPHFGRLGPVGDAGAMAANIVELLRGDHRGMGLAAGRDAEAHCSWPSVFEQLTAMYQVMVGP